MSWWIAPIGKKSELLVLIGGFNRDQRLFGPIVSVGATNRDKYRTLVLVGGFNWDKRPLCLHTPRLAVGTGTKTLFCPGSKTAGTNDLNQKSVM